MSKITLSGVDLGNGITEMYLYFDNDPDFVAVEWFDDAIRLKLTMSKKQMSKWLNSPAELDGGLRAKVRSAFFALHDSVI